MNNFEHERLEQERLDRHNEVMLTCVNASIKAVKEHPNGPKANAFFEATMNWYTLPEEGED